MRIALITYEYPPDSAHGGIATYFLEAATALSAGGHDVEVFAHSSLRQGHFQEDGFAVNWIDEPDQKDFAVAAGYTFLGRHRERPFDVIEGPEYNAHARKAAALAPECGYVIRLHTPTRLLADLDGTRTSWASRFTALPSQLKMLAGSMRRQTLLSPIDLEVRPDRDFIRTLDSLEGREARRCDEVVALCRDLRDYAVDQWKVPEERVVLIPYPYRLRSEFLALAEGSQNKRVGYFGRLEERKGVLDLAAAAPAILAQHPEAEFYYVGQALDRPGDGRSYTDLIGEAAHGVPAEKIHFTGRIPLEEIPAMMGKMSVVVFPSHWENFPFVCLEAMAAARAIVGSQAGGMRDMLDDGKAGRLVAPKEKVAIAEAVNGLLDDPNERLRLGKQARERVVNLCDPVQVAKSMEASYERARTRAAARTANGSA